jgi:hypothetical protein
MLNFLCTILLFSIILTAEENINIQSQSNLQGIDSNKDGVRDDLEIFIKNTLQKKEEQTIALTYAKSIQATFDIKTKKELKDWSDPFYQSIRNMEKTFGKDSKIINEINDKTFNTKESESNFSNLMQKALP